MSHTFCKKAAAATSKAAKRAHAGLDEVGGAILSQFQSDLASRGGRQGYDGRNSPGSMLQSVRLLFRMRGSVFPRILLPSLLAGLFAALLVAGTGKDAEEGWLPRKALRLWW